MPVIVSNIILMSFPCVRAGFFSRVFFLSFLLLFRFAIDLVFPQYITICACFCFTSYFFPCVPFLPHQTVCHGRVSGVSPTCFFRLGLFHPPSPLFFFLSLVGGGCTRHKPPITSKNHTPGGFACILKIVQASVFVFASRRGPIYFVFW